MDGSRERRGKIERKSNLVLGRELRFMCIAMTPGESNCREKYHARKSARRLHREVHA